MNGTDVRVSLLFILSISVASPTAHAQSVKGICFPADQTTARVVRYFKGIVTPMDSLQWKLRADLLLNAVTSAQVTPVADDQTCAKAAAAMDTLADTKKKKYHLYVVRVGDATVADRAHRALSATVAPCLARNWLGRGHKTDRTELAETTV